MTALSGDRDTKRRDGEFFDLEVAASVVIYMGALVCGNATGYATPGDTATTLEAMGVAQERVDNASGANGAKTVRVRAGVFHFQNSGGGDLITRADRGKLAYIVDDQTVAKTDGTGTRSVAGRIIDVDDNGLDGVWVKVGPDVA